MKEAVAEHSFGRGNSWRKEQSAGSTASIGKVSQILVASSSCQELGELGHSILREHNEKEIGRRRTQG